MSLVFSKKLPAPVGALFTAQGLNAVYLGQPSHLRLRLAYPAAGGDVAPVIVTLDVEAAGATLPANASAAPVIPGRALPIADAGGLAWQWWPTGEMLEVTLPELRFTGAPGLRTVPLTIHYGGPEPARLALPLVCLQLASNLAASTGRVLTEVVHAKLTGPGEGETDPGTVALRISYPVSQADNTLDVSPTFYLLLSEGLTPGQAALVAPEAAEAIELSLGEETVWQVTRLAGLAYPAWSLHLLAGHALPAGPLNVQLQRVHQPAGGRAHVLVYGLAVPGAGDGGQVVSLRGPGEMGRQVGSAGDGDVSIVRFEATPTTLSVPGTVRLSWQVRNASYVTISGLGKVPNEASDWAVVVEETTTFVLLAYGAGLSQLESRTLQVQVPVSRQVVRGTILLWSGQLDTIPTGWALCDGGDNRPDLRDRFVLGAGGRAQPHQRGEPDTHTHEMKGYEIPGRTEVAGKHSHRMPEQWYDRNINSIPMPIFSREKTIIDTNGSSIKEAFTQEAGEHSHAFTVTLPTVTTSPNNSANRPAWYSLCYIVKL